MNIHTEVIHSIEKDGKQYIRFDSYDWFVEDNGVYNPVTNPENLELEFSDNV